MLGLTNTSGTWDQCSRLKPSYEFHFWRALKFQPFNWRVGSNPRRQSKNLEKEIQNSYYNLCMNYMVHVSSTMWKKIKNQPSNSTSCSDNALARLLVLVVGQVTSSFSIWCCVLKGCFERGIFSNGQIAFEEHWRLQSWTMLASMLGLTNMSGTWDSIVNRPSDQRAGHPIYLP